MPLSYDDHGGECCGITHIWDFHSVEPKDTLVELNKVIGKICERVYKPHLVEVVLNAPQKVGGKREKALLDLGFKEVNNFVNGNTDNKCFVYHLVLEPGPEDFEEEEYEEEY